MGKRLKKGRTPPSGNRSAAVSKKVTEQSGENMEIAEEPVVAMTEKRSCVHFDKGVNLDKLLEKIKSSQQIKCGECKEGVHVKRGGSKGKVHSGRNGFSSSDAKSAKKAIWVCLDCGYYVCGGVGLPTGAQSHVMKHIRLTRHRLVIQCENPQLRWCFPCQSILPFEKEENGEKKDLLLEVVKLIEERSSNTNSASADTEDSCSGSGSITSETKLEYTVSSGIGARNGYAVRGLVNLGNTCFFNSVLQNLLSLDQLRDHFLKEDLSGGGGPLVSSQKKLFAETKSELGLLKSVINPKVFFGSVCSKAPQFKGYQQHDSHELLRYLLDGLSIEESSMRKKLSVSDSDDSSTHHKPTLIDSVFGGEISRTVSCLECGHSSKVYEPFLDLSLPVPTKKPAPKKQQTLPRAKKGKVPPKKVLKNGAVSKDSEIASAKPALDQNSTVSVLETPAMALDNNKQASEIATQSDTEFDNFWLDIIGPGTSHNETDMVSQGNISDTAPGPEITVSAPVSSGDQTLVGSSETLMHDNYGSAKPAPVPGEEDAGAVQSNEDTPASGISEEIDEAQVCGDPDLGQSSSSANPWGDEELPLMVADSEVLYMPYYQDDISYDDNIVAESKEGEASSSFVSGPHEKTEDGVDYNRFIDEPGLSSNDKTVGEREGEASSSFVNSGNEENVDYVDFGGLFDEPEVSEGPVFGPPSRAEVSETGFMAVSSDSDPEELDDSASPVSVDRCLAHFTKPEILSDDNAWHCENCSKKLKLQQLRETKEGLGNGEVNENGASSASDECRDNPSNQTCIDLENGYKAESSSCKEEKNAIDDGTLGDSDTKQPPIASSAAETISSQPGNGNESEKREDEVVDTEKVIVKRDASKRVLVNKAPPVLTIHLKRFSQDARGRLSKLSGHVDFKEFIDLRQYMDSRLTEEEDDQPVYRLAGLVEHSGTMRGGHYVAYIRGGHKERSAKEPNSSIWYYASDSYVRKASFEEVLRSEAYILFYERI